MSQDQLANCLFWGFQLKEV